MTSTATLHFHGELAALARSDKVVYALTRRASVKDVIEALGVPHTEVYSLAVDGQPAAFGHLLGPGQEVRAWPGVPPVDVTAPGGLRAPLRAPRFAADANVGRLATYLRLLGIDTFWSNSVEDGELAALAASEGRVVLTTDRGVLRRKAVEWGRLVRKADPVEQARDVVRFFGLTPLVRPMTLCVRCNAALEPVDKALVLHLLRPLTRKHHEHFHHCPSCGRVYWPGTHHAMMQDMARRLTAPG